MGGNSHCFRYYLTIFSSILMPISLKIHFSFLHLLEISNKIHRSIGFKLKTISSVCLVNGDHTNTVAFLRNRILVEEEKPILFLYLTSTSALKFSSHTFMYMSTHKKRNKRQGRDVAPSSDGMCKKES